MRRLYHSGITLTTAVCTARFAWPVYFEIPIYSGETSGANPSASDGYASSDQSASHLSVETLNWLTVFKQPRTFILEERKIWN